MRDDVCNPHNTASDLDQHPEMKKLERENHFVDLEFIEGKSSPPIAASYDDKDMWTILTNVVITPKSNESKTF